MTDWAARWIFSNHWFHHGVPVHKHPQQLTLAWDGDHIPQTGRQNFWWMSVSDASKPFFIPAEANPESCLSVDILLWSSLCPPIWGFNLIACIPSRLEEWQALSGRKQTEWQGGGFDSMTGAAGRSRNLMVRNGKGRPSMGDGGFPGKQLRGGWESLGLPSNCWLPPSVSLMVHMAAGAASNCPDFSGTCCPLSVLHVLSDTLSSRLCTAGKCCLRDVASSGAGLSVLCWGLLTG